MKKFKKLKDTELNSVKGGEPVGPGETYLGGGYDAGGHFIIVDTGTSCVKRYQPCAFER